MSDEGRKCDNCGYIATGNEFGPPGECPACSAVYAKATQRKQDIRPVNTGVGPGTYERDSSVFTGPVMIVLATLVILLLLWPLLVDDTGPEQRSSPPPASPAVVATAPPAPATATPAATSADLADTFPGSTRLLAILAELQRAAEPFGVEIRMRDLRPAYEHASALLGVEELDLGNAERLGIALPNTQAVTDAEWNSGKTVRCRFELDGVKYLNELPGGDQGIDDCWEQTEQRRWEERRWDGAVGAWVQFTQEQRSAALRSQLRANADAALARLDATDTEAQRAFALDRAKAAKAEVDTYLQAVRDASDDDPATGTARRKLRRAESRLRAALVLGESHQIQRIAVEDTLAAEGIGLE